MPRSNTTNRFAQAGKTLVSSESEKTSKTATAPDVISQKTGTEKTKSRGITAKVYPETWDTFTKICQAQGMTNSSVINMLISSYIRENKNLLDDK